jgi:hypothetical protein
MSGEVIDARLFFGLRGMRKAPRRPAQPPAPQIPAIPLPTGPTYIPLYQHFLLKDLSVRELERRLRGTGLAVSVAESGVLVLHESDPPPTAA